MGEKRKKELMEYLTKKCDAIMVEPMVEQFVHLEEQLEELKNLPFININPQNPKQQKSTSAAKLYKELLQQYVNIYRTINRQNEDGEEKESLLRKWVKQHVSEE